MAVETVVKQETPAAVKPETPPAAVQPEVKQEPVKETPKEDLISRVSKVKVEPPKSKEEGNPFGLTKEDYDKVQNDPVLSKFYKSMQADYIRKTQEAAEIKKQSEEKLKQSSTWTTERLQQEINKPDFVQAAQQLASLNNPPNSGLTDSEYSALTEKEKAQLQLATQEINALKMQNWQMQQRQEDESLRTRYANYDSDYVDTTIKQMMNNEVRATRETVWKALDYENAVRRAYELGKEDRKLEVQDKTNSASFMGGINATPSDNVPQPSQGESSRAYFKRVAEFRLAEARKGQNR